MTIAITGIADLQVRKKIMQSIVKFCSVTVTRNHVKSEWKFLGIIPGYLKRSQIIRDAVECVVQTKVFVDQQPDGISSIQVYLVIVSYSAPDQVAIVIVLKMDIVIRNNPILFVQTVNIHVGIE